MSRLLDFLASMQIALEADDITQQTQAEVRSAIGGAIPSATQEPNDEENLMQTDNIFDKPPGDDDPAGNPEQDQVEGAEGLPPEEGNPDEENPEDPNAENAQTDPNLTGDQNPTEGETQSDEDLLFAKKNRIRDNLIQLYTIISSDIEILVNSITTINEPSTIRVVNNVLGHLRNSKTFLYKTLTQNLNSLEYDELLQRYVTIRRVYDICIEMLKQYFDENSNAGKALRA